jgi:phosphohistidine phosphatase
LTRQLYLLRHAKSDWTTDTPNDFQRPLNDRGERNARKMGKWMAEQGMMPEVVISSPALRAWQTASLACLAIGLDVSRVDFQSDLYLADLDTLLRTINSLPNDTSSAMLVGHNPGLNQLVGYLAANDVPASADGKVMATATLARFDIEDEWPDVVEARATLVQLHRAR